MSYIRPQLSGLGSNDSMPRPPRKAFRGLGAEAIEYPISSVAVVRAIDKAQNPPPPPPPPQKMIGRPALPMRIVRGRPMAFGSNQSMPLPPRKAFRGLGSLGDTPPAASIGTDQATAEWQSKMLAATTQMTTSTAEYMQKETMQRWIQIAATLSIPLAAAIWRMIFRGGSTMTPEG